MLREAIGGLYFSWLEIRNYVFEKQPSALEEWNFPRQKYGWSFRIKDKKRAIIYLIPCKNYFLVVFVFGSSATTEALLGTIDQKIKTIFESARVYAEGPGFSIEIRDSSYIADIKALVDIKVSN